jgi:2-polyprenyl-3-methyl-5-hydroxy-6-metoxy-1,4-benzoquinol methylase
MNRKTREALRVLLEAGADERSRLYRDFYERRYHRPAVQARIPKARRRRRVELFRKLLKLRDGLILELGCGLGDLSSSVAAQGQSVVGTDISLAALRTAAKRAVVDQTSDGWLGKLAFVQMNAIQLGFVGGRFDYVVSTSMVEHLHPGDIQSHLREVHRVLKPSGVYLVWCPNGLGHHGDRDFHLTMLSHRGLMSALKGAGFRQFRSLMFNRYPFYIDSKWKIFLEDLLTRWKIGVLWSHLGVRNILLLASK